MWSATRCTELAALTAALAGASCTSRAHVVVTIEDPGGLARNATEVHFGRVLGEYHTSRPLDGARFPLTVALASTGDDPGGQLFVEARAGGAAIARGSTELTFDATRPAAAIVRLGHACERAADCDDGTFCNGAEQCLLGVCAAGSPPCPATSVSCVAIGCLEAESACAVELGAGVDDLDPCTLDGCSNEPGVSHFPDVLLEGMRCVLAHDPSTIRFCTNGTCLSSECPEGVACFPRLEHISLDPSGNPAKIGTGQPSLTHDGRYVAFVAPDCLSIEGVDWIGCLRDRPARTNTALLAGPINAEIGAPVISADGRVIVFIRVVPGDSSHAVEVLDRGSGAITRIVEPEPPATLGYGVAVVAVSHDGSVVLLATRRGYLVPGDDNNKIDVFVYDRTTAQMTRVNVASDGTQADDHAEGASMNRGGALIAFTSRATTLVPGGIEESYVYVHDRSAGTTERVTPGSGQTSLSADGRRVAFVLGPHVHVFDRMTGENTRVSVTPQGIGGNGESTDPVLSADGRFVVFLSEATNLVPGTAEAGRHLFIRALETGETRQLDVADDGTSGTETVWSPAISGDGRSIAFVTSAPELLPAGYEPVRDDVAQIYVARNPLY